MASYGDIKFATRGDRKSIKGLAWPFKTTNTGGMCSNNYNEECVRQGLIQLLLTSRGERPMRLDYGTELRRSVFAPFDGTTISDLRSSVLDSISKYEPRVIVKSFVITPYEDTSRIDIDLEFSLKSSALSFHHIQLRVDSQGVTLQ